MYKPLKDLSIRHRNRLRRQIRENYAKPDCPTTSTSSCGQHNTMCTNTNSKVLADPDILGKINTLSDNSSNLICNYASDEVNIVSSNKQLDEKVPLFESTDEERILNVHNKITKPKLIVQLKEWSIQHNISQIAMSDLLVILKDNGLNVPIDSRTIMKTPRSVNVRDVHPGKYCHIGLQIGILRSLEMYYSSAPKDIGLNFNIDGLPLTSSSSSQFWPILCSLVEDFYTEPFAVGIFHGFSKPTDVNEYLSEFVNEVKKILEDGIVWKNSCINVTINCFICDTPARSYITCVKNHTGYFGCGKCIQEGEYVEHRVTFPELNSTLRTDDNFKTRMHEDHHRGDSILESLSIGMVSQMPLDYMHLVCLGVTKKLLQFWIKGKLDVRIPNGPQQMASKLFLSYASYIPDEFARKPRSLLDCDKWKATELRQFLLYTGIIILKDVLSNERYVHFLSLTCAIRILASTNMCVAYNSYADELLRYFVRKYGSFYGNENITFNVHNLIHLSKDVLKFGSIDTFSAFKYENFMYLLKKKVKTSSKPLEQISNRIHEILSSDVIPPSKSNLEVHITRNGVKVVKFKNYQFSTIVPNNVCLLKDQTVVIITDIFQLHSNIFIKGEQFLNSESFFKVPCDSKDFGIQICDRQNFNNIQLNISEIETKCIMIYINDISFVTLPMIHRD